TDYLTAKLTRPAWRTGGASPPSPLDAELDRARWHRERVGYGVLTLAALREFVGAEPVAAALDAFGRGAAGKEGAVAEFAAAVSARTGKDVAKWLAGRGADPKVGGAAFTTAYWLGEPESAVIVYGTGADVAANRAAAAALQTAVRLGYGNVVVPVK